MSTKITVRTVSNLPEIEKVDDIQDNSLIQMSVKDSDSGTGKYISKKLQYQTLNTKITNSISTFNKTQYGITPGSNIETDISVLQNNFSSNANFLSTVEFTKYPTVKSGATPPTGDRYLVTASDVSSIILNDSNSFITLNSKCYEVTLTASVAQSKGTTEPCNKITIPNTGTLVLYGALADTGVVAPAEAWVGLKGKIDSLWKYLQIQPWIMGSKSNQMQYVSFTGPVAKGLEIGIETGFIPSDINSGAQNTNRSLITDGANKVFKGYVIGK